MCFHHHASLSFHTLTPSSQILPRIYFLTESKVSLLDIPHKHHVADYFPYLSPNRQQFTFFFLLQTSFVPCAFTLLPSLLLHTLPPPCSPQHPCMSLSYPHPASSLHLFQSPFFFQPQRSSCSSWPVAVPILNWPPLHGSPALITSIHNT